MYGLHFGVPINLADIIASVDFSMALVSKGLNNWVDPTPRSLNPNPNTRIMRNNSTTYSECPPD